MNDLEKLMMVTWALMAISGIFAYKGVLAIQDLVADLRRKKMYPAIGPAKPETMCEGPHTWDKIKLALSGLPVETYMV